MIEGKDILESIGKEAYTVPEGYFDNLKGRLSSLTSAEEKSTENERSVWMKLKPYMALAACFIVMIAVGNIILQLTADKAAVTSETDQDYAILAELTPVTQPDAIYMPYEENTEAMSEEDIINYLIESGTTAEHIEYIGQENK